jgi:hypothetical protein
MASIKDLQDECHARARGAGWWADFFSMPEGLRKYYIGCKMALIHSEVSEALEGFRTGIADPHLPERSNVEVELADAVIRIFDLAGGLGLNLEEAIAEKMEYNAHRADHTREARAAKGGKSI